MTIYENNNPFAPKMTRLDFINELKKLLSPLSESERNKSILYYNEFIDDRIEDGMTEVDAIACLESPAVIADRILSEMGFSQGQAQSQPLPKMKNINRGKVKSSAGTVALIILGFPIWFPLIITVASLAFALVITVWSLVFSLLVTALACVAACIAAVVVAPIVLFGGHLVSSIFCAGTGLISGAVGIVLAVLSVKLVKATWTFTKFFTRKTLGLLRRR